MTEIKKDILDLETKSDINLLARGAGIVLFGKSLGRGVQFLTLVMLARVLGPASYGFYAIGWSVISIGSQIGLLGLDNGIIKYGGQYLAQDDNINYNQVIRHSIFLALSAGLLISTIIYLSASLLAEFVFDQPSLIDLLRDVSVAVFFAVGLRMISSVTRLSKRMQFSVLAEEIFPIFINALFVVILVAVFKMGVKGAIIAISLGYGIGFVVALYYLKGLFPTILHSISLDMSVIKPLLVFSLPTLIASMFNLLLIKGSITVLLLSVFRSSKEVGIFQAVSQLSIFPTIIIVSFNAIFGPMISTLYHSGKNKRLNELFKISTKWGLYITLPFFVVVMNVPKEIMKIVFGYDYVGGTWLLIIFTLAQLFNVGTGAVGYILLISGYERRWLYILGGAFIVGFLLNLWVIPRWGMFGAAIITSGRIGIAYFLALFQVRNLHGLWPYDFRYYKGVLSALLSTLAIIVLRWFWASDSLIFLVVSIFLSWVIFIIGLVVLGLDDEDRYVLRLFSSQVCSLFS